VCVCFSASAFFQVFFLNVCVYIDIVVLILLMNKMQLLFIFLGHRIKFRFGQFIVLISFSFQVLLFMNKYEKKVYFCMFFHIFFTLMVNALCMFLYSFRCARRLTGG